MKIVKATKIHLNRVRNLNERVLTVDGMYLGMSYKIPELIHKGRVLLAVENNRVVGALTYDEPDEDWFRFKSETAREIITLAIHPDFQKSGIGTALISALENKLKKRNISKLYVATYHKFGCSNFYKKVGFKLIRKDYSNFYFKKTLTDARSN